MAFNENLANKLRETFLAKNIEIEEKRMFGGITFMYKGKMCCGVATDELMVRVVVDKMEKLLERPYVREMDFTGRPLKGFLYVGQEALQSVDSFREWIEYGIEQVESQLKK